MSFGCDDDQPSPAAAPHDSRRPTAVDTTQHSYIGVLRAAAHSCCHVICSLGDYVCRCTTGELCRLESSGSQQTRRRLYTPV